jgi:hypothetical protein
MAKMKSKTQTAQIPFDAMPKRKRRRPRTPSHPSRSLAVEHVVYNIEGGHCATCPFIRLKGRWLERAGFKVDSRVVVMVSQGCLVIRPLQRTRPNVDNKDERELT